MDFFSVLEGSGLVLYRLLSRFPRWKLQFKNMDFFSLTKVRILRLKKKVDGVFDNYTTALDNRLRLYMYKVLEGR